MEKHFPESESLSIKRLKVAIERKNWELLEKGLKKALEMRTAGHKFRHPDLWQNLLLWAESEDIPPELWEKLSDFVDKLSDDIPQAVQNFGVIPEYHEETANLIDKEVAIVYNRNFDKNTLARVKRHRLNLDNIILNPDKHSFEHKWMEELAEFATVLDEPQEELNGFISLLLLFRDKGSIITNSYSANIHKMLVKAEVNFAYPGTKADAKKSGNTWEFFPLGGTINSFVCTGCGHRSIKTEYYSKTLVECCGKCKKPMYPDMACAADSYSQTLPQTWYGAYERLISSKIWVLINPPSHNDQISLRNMLLDAAKSACVEEIHIITHKPEVFELWKSKFVNLIKDITIKDNQPTIISFLESYNETVVAES